MGLFIPHSSRVYEEQRGINICKFILRFITNENLPLNVYGNLHPSYKPMAKREFML